MPSAGVVLPRGAFEANALGLLQVAWAVPLDGWFDRSLWVGLTGGYTQLSGVESVAVPRMGRTDRVQRTPLGALTFDATFAPGAGWSVRPYAGVGAGVFITRTEVDTFWQTEPQNDAAPAIVGFAGAWVPMELGEGLLGLLTFELRYAEARAELGSAESYGEDVLSHLAITAGFGFQL